MRIVYLYYRADGSRGFALYDLNVPNERADLKRVLAHHKAGSFKDSIASCEFYQLENKWSMGEVEAMISHYPTHDPS